MGVPEEIRAVSRPKNTIVFEMKNGGYGVRERKGNRYVKGKHTQPINGKVIGHIVNGKYIPLVSKQPDEPTFLSFGSAALVKECAVGIQDDLMKIYPLETSLTLMAMAMLKVIRPSIVCGRYATEYQRSFVSEYVPNCHLSRNTIHERLNDVGMDGNSRKKFYMSRMTNLPTGHHVAIDGTLRQDESIVNSLSGYSYKSRIKGTKDVSVIYAYDIETKEPLCSTVFPGNSIDASSYHQFITENGVNKGIIVSDKGFPVSAIEDILKQNTDLHFLTPLRRNDTRIETNRMLDFEEVVDGVEGDIVAKKAKIKEGRYLYSFKDMSTAGKEAHDFVKHAKNDEFNPEKYAKKKDSFGVITLESDLNMTCREAYLCYAERWKLELVFRAYKNDEYIDKTSVQGDYAVIGMEFVNFLSTLITTRVIEKMRNSGLLKKYSYDEIMEDLSSAWREKEGESDHPSENDGNWIHTIPSVMEEMKMLGLLKEKMEEKKKGRGRPKKSTTTA